MEPDREVVSPAAASTPMPVPVLRFVERSRAAMAAILAVGVSDLLGIFANLWYTAFLQGLPPQVVLVEVENDASVFVYNFSSIANLGVTIIAGTCFILWFHRAYTNLGHITSLPRGHGDSWTAWGFIVPILSLVRPYSIMDEIRERSEYRWDEQPDAFHGYDRPEVRVKLWWGCYLAKVFAESFTMRLGWNASTANETLVAANAEMFCSFAELIAVFPAVMIIQSITSLQVPILARAFPQGSSAPHKAERRNWELGPRAVDSGTAENALPPPPPGLITG